MGSAFNQLCPRYFGTLFPTAPMAIRLWEIFTFFEPIDRFLLNLHGYTCIRGIIFQTLNVILYCTPFSRFQDDLVSTYLYFTLTQVLEAMDF